MEIPHEIELTHRELSPLDWRFLQHAVTDPQLTRRFDLNSLDLPAWIRRYTYTLQSWPTFVGEDKLSEIRRVTLGVTALVKSIPERVFRGDRGRFAAFYGLENEVMAQLLLEPPNGIPEALTRVDFVDSPQGLRVLETNIGAYLGGWQLRFWQEHCLSQPGILRFLEQQEDEVHYRDPFRVLFEHVVESTIAAGVADDGEVNLVLGVEEPELEIARAGRETLQTLFEEVLFGLDSRLRGQVLIGAYPQALEVRGERTFFEDGRRAHAVLEYAASSTPAAIYHCFKKGNVSIYSGPAAAILGRKSSLGLLSELGGSGLFSARERDLIERYIPWSRVVRPGNTLWRGDDHSLLELLVTRREDFVLKPVGGNQGANVYVGRFTPADEWREVVARAVDERTWLAQEHVESHPYLFQSGDQGCAPHDVVWGTFCFGRRYGGSFLRLQPRGEGSGVINSALGATEGIVYEVSSPSRSEAPVSTAW